MVALEETFAGALGRWRVEDKRGEEGRDAKRAFAVMAWPSNMRLPTEADDAEFVAGCWFELCAVQYRPHAQAIAALPELALAGLGLLEKYESKVRSFDCDKRAAFVRAIAKAEGRDA